MTPRRVLTALAIVIGLAHLPFLASTLEDIDSVNFALGVRDFDVAAHRPHPPGYPVYIAMGKVAAAIVGAVSGAAAPSTIEARALSLLSWLAAMLLPFLVYRVFAAARAVRDQTPPWTGLDAPALATAALTLTNPLIWTMTVRPMSDLPGLTLALAAQACLLTAWWWQTPPADGDRRLEPEMTAMSGRMLVVGALLAGLAIGLRTQTLWLTAPVLLAVLVDRIGRGVAGALIGATMTSAIGALAWAVPLVVVSGGMQEYLAALGTQAGEDFASGEMLYLNPAPRLIALALVHTFIDPWDGWLLALPVLALAAAGAVHLLWRDRRTLALVAAMGVPYLVFHLLFQDTSFIRYAMPLVPMVAFLAVQGAALVSARAVIPVAAALSLAAVAVATPTTMTYATAPAPAVQVLDAINAEAAKSPPGALAMHQTFQRPLEAERVTVTPQLPSPPRREWLELTRFWQQGHTGPVWFLADPRRSDLALIDPQSRRDVVPFRWEPTEHLVFGGMRPAAVDWVRMTPPRWFAEEGWSLTPETAGMAALMGRAPHLGPITARVRRDPQAVRILVGGRSLAGPHDPAARFTLSIDGRVIDTWDVAPGYFLRIVELPSGSLALTPGALAPEGALAVANDPWAALTIASTAVSGSAPIPTAIEQFDLQPADTLMWAFDRGWYEAEYTPALGVWHWAGPAATLRVFNASSALRVTMEIESPLRYFGQPSDVVARAGTVELARATIADTTTWSFDVPAGTLPAASGEIVIETTQTFVPAERGGPPDLRALGLRVFNLRIEHVGLR
ncbi:MAG: DUF2723 domain-containing protein [Acidobacteria bacterium]|nr:DUF2723 domain-containing protein [Acidobacteriota bacterium]